MSNLRDLLGISLLAVGTSAVSPTVQTSPEKNQSAVKWGPCEESLSQGPIPVQCGTLAVPLDYTDEASTATINVSLLKVSATTNGTSKGSVLFNPGGPGMPGRDDVQRNAASYLKCVRLHWRS